MCRKIDRHGKTDGMTHREDLPFCRRLLEQNPRPDRAQNPDHKKSQRIIEEQIDRVKNINIEPFFHHAPIHRVHEEEMADDILQKRNSKKRHRRKQGRERPAASLFKKDDMRRQAQKQVHKDHFHIIRRRLRECIHPFRDPIPLKIHIAEKTVNTRHQKDHGSRQNAKPQDQFSIRFFQKRSPHFFHVDYSHCTIISEEM